MAVDSLDDATAQLYGHPAASFVAERDALVKQLRAAKQRDLANEVKSLRKPSAVAAEVNRVVRADPAGVEMILQAAELLRAAQAGHLDGDAINVAELQQHYRAAIQAMAQTADTKRAEVRAALEAATIDVDSNAALRSGSLVVVPTPVSVFANAPAVAVPADELAARRLAKAQTEPKTQSDEPTAAEAKQEAAAEAKRQRAREKAAEKAAQKERAQRRRVLDQQHREALRAQLAALDELEALRTTAAALADDAAELDEQSLALEQQLIEVRTAAEQARTDQQTAEQAQLTAADRAEEAESLVQQLADELDKLAAE